MCTLLFHTIGIKWMEPIYRPCSNTIITLEVLSGQRPFERPKKVEVQRCQIWTVWWMLQHLPSIPLIPLFGHPACTRCRFSRRMTTPNLNWPTLFLRTSCLTLYNILQEQATPAVSPWEEIHYSDTFGIPEEYSHNFAQRSDPLNFVIGGESVYNGVNLCHWCDMTHPGFKASDDLVQ